MAARIARELRFPSCEECVNFNSILPFLEYQFAQNSTKFCTNYERIIFSYERIIFSTLNLSWIIFQTNSLCFFEGIIIQEPCANCKKPVGIACELNNSRRKKLPVVAVSGDEKRKTHRECSLTAPRHVTLCPFHRLTSPRRKKMSCGKAVCEKEDPTSRSIAITLVQVMSMCQTIVMWRPEWEWPKIPPHPPNPD
jgi:hypothetical protein